jgi:5-methylcytosine-specific restriction endonuclease McrA
MGKLLGLVETSRFPKGNIPWNKGRQLFYPVWNKGITGLPPRHTTKHSEETKRKCSEAQKKRWASGAYENRVLDYKAIAEKSSVSHLKSTPRGKDHWLWKNGLTKRNTNTHKYRKWRTTVFERDNYTCQYCLTRGGFLHAHHIETWHKVKKKRYLVSNGLTLCKKCHHKLHSKRS